MNQCRSTGPHGQKMAPAHVSGLQPDRLTTFPQLRRGRPITTRAHPENGNVIHPPGSGSEAKGPSSSLDVTVYTSRESFSSIKLPASVLVRRFSSGAASRNTRNDKSFIKGSLSTATIPDSEKGTLYPCAGIFTQTVRFTVYKPMRGVNCFHQEPTIYHHGMLPAGSKTPSPQEKSSQDLGST